MLKPAKQPHIRLTALFLCVTMFLSTLFFNAHTAYAADGTIDYKAGAKIPYGDYYTSRMSFDGNNTAYCVEPLKKTPASGQYPYNLLGKDSPLRKALYYVNGGYGYEKLIKDQYFQGWSDDNSYVIGHLVVSYIHAGNNGDNIRIKHVSEVNLYETETNPLPILRQHRNFKGCVLCIWK